MLYNTRVQNRDSFQRQQTGLLHKQAGTRPLGPNTKPLPSPEVLRAQAREMLAKAQEQLEGLEARIELLLRSAEKGGLNVPGVEFGDYKHPLSPKGEQIIGYLAGVYAANQEVARAVQVGVFRYHDAVASAARLREAADGDEDMQPGMLEDLRLKMFYLTRYHVDFKGDRVLAQLFPAPQNMSAIPGMAKGTVPLSNVERLKQKQLRDAVLHKAEILRAGLAPKMEVVKTTLEMLDNPRLNIGALFTPATRSARLIALGMGGNQELKDKLRETHRLFGVLEEQLGAARNGGDFEPLKETIYPLGRLALDCQRHALLRDLFPLGEKDLFPQEGEASEAR